MDVNEARNEILKIILKDAFYASPGRMADLITKFIAPELEKAKLWNGAMDVIQNFHATDRRNRNMNMVEIINYVEDLEKALTDALEGEKNAKKV